VPLQGAILESHRFGVELVSPDQIFKQKSTCSIPSGPFPTIQYAAARVFGDNTGKLLNVGGYVTGWFNCFDANPAVQQGGVLGVMEAYDEAHAKSLAQVLTLSSSGQASSGTLAGLPDAYLGLYPTLDGNSGLNAIVVAGRMLAYVNVDTGRTKGGAARLPETRTMAAQLLKAEVAKLKSFKPTPVDKIGSIDDDPELLDGKTAQPDGAPDWYAGGYTLDTFPAAAVEPAKQIPMLKRNGMSEVYLRSGYPTGDSHAPIGGVTLFKLANAKAAKNVWKAELALAKDQDPKPTGLPLPKGKPRAGAPPVPKNIECLLTYGSTDAKSFKQECWLLAGRYVAQIDLLWSADVSTAAHTRSKDSSRVLALVNKQLALTPQ